MLSSSRYIFTINYWINFRPIANIKLRTLKTNTQSPYIMRFMTVGYTVRIFCHPVHQTSFRTIFVYQSFNRPKPKGKTL